MASSYRIVSLVPSLTHSLCRYGLEECLVGITQFCVDPPSLHRRAKIVGGTKDPDIDLIFTLKPTHIITNFEENRTEDIERLKEVDGVKVIETKIIDFEDMCEVLRCLGDAFCLDVSSDIENILNCLRYLPPKKPKSCIYLIWKNPYMTVGNNTLISKSLERLGYTNLIDRTSRYPEVSMNEMISLKPEVIFFSSEPYPFRKRDVQKFIADWSELSDSVPPLCLSIDGKYTSWYLHYSMDLLSKSQQKNPPFIVPFCL